jgi:hypothetical protein
LPFAMLLSLTVMNIWRVWLWMRRTADPFHYSIPLAMVLIAGLTHASFEDWLFAVGSYPCVFFWTFSFILADLAPATAVASAPAFFVRPAQPRAQFGVAVPHQ